MPGSLVIVLVREPRLLESLLEELSKLPQLRHNISQPRLNRLGTYCLIPLSPAHKPPKEGFP